MLFDSYVFALFLPVMLLTYWSLKGDARRWVLLFGNYFFYGWWDWRFCGLLGFSTVLDFLCAAAMDRSTVASSRKRILFVSVVLNLGLLAAFKYFNFFRDSAALLFEALGIHSNLPLLNVVLPMGISFYTFQTMSYVIDVYRGEKPERSLLNFALFVSCFPHLVAGPIVRADSLLPQLATDRRFDQVNLSTGAYRIFRGLFKKMVVADALALYVDAVFAEPTAYAGLGAWIGLYAYAFQIYMDFSGYSDVAIGTGQLLGLKFAENFDGPYLAVSPSDFWRRWHITLSTWLRDYLYIPLGGSRGSTARTVRNLMITMALGGLWHGAAWTFVAWGVYHGMLLVGERLAFGRRRQASTLKPELGTRILAVVVMFHLTCAGWLLFRSPDWQTVLTMLRAMTDFSAAEVRGLRVAVIILACAIAHALPLFRTLPDRFARLPALGQGALAAVCLWSLLLLSPEGKPFIYFQF